MATFDDRQRLTLDEGPHARLRDALVLAEQLVDRVVVDLSRIHANDPRLAPLQGPSRRSRLATERVRSYE